MADLTITASQVLYDSNAPIERGIAAVAITAGQVVYLDTTTSTYKLFDADLAAAYAGTPKVALHSTGAGQPIAVQGRGATITLGAGAAPVAGTVYVASGTAGGICPAADLASGDRVATIGIGASSNRLVLECSNSGVTI